MSKKRKYHCDCKNWEPGIDSINSGFAMATVFPGHPQYTGEEFSFCPWCGKSVVFDDGEPADRMKRLDGLADELFKTANLYALEHVSGVGMYLHEAVNNIWKAQKVVRGEMDSSPPLSMLLSSMGLGESGTGVSLNDLLMKDEQYEKDLGDKKDA